MKLVDADSFNRICSLWSRHVRHVMGRVRMPVKTLFGAAAKGWFGSYAMVNYVED